MSKQLKIVFAIPELDNGGPDQVFFEIINFLALNTNHQFFLMTTKENGFYLKKLNKKIKIIIIKRPFRIWSRYPVDAALIKTYEIKPDVVLTTLRMNLVFNFIYKFLPRKTKLITRIANDISSNSEFLRKLSFKSYLGNLFSKSLISNTDMILCQSRYMKKDLKKYINCKTKISHIYNPVPSKILPQKIKLKRSKSDPPIFISVGRLEYQKGFDILIKSFQKVLKVLPDAKLFIYGEGSQKSILKDLTIKLAVANNVVIKGFSNNISNELKNADLFLLASRFEGFSNALLEALFLGIPVITSNCPGANSEIIKKGINGYLAKNEDSSDLSEKIIKGVNHNWDRNQIQKDTKDLFSREKISFQYLKILLNIVT